MKPVAPALARLQCATHQQSACLRQGAQPLLPVYSICHKILTFTTLILRWQMLADGGRLTTTASLLLNLALAGVSLQHVVLLSRAIAGGLAGPIAPVLLAAWGTALATAVYNTPLSVQGSE